MADSDGRARVQDVIAAIEAGFAVTPHPGVDFLLGSREGCEPVETIDPVRAFADWRHVPSDVLDANYNALSFFSEGGFRFFLPAYLVADLRGRLQTADPMFHLTSGFTTTTVRVPTTDRALDRRVGGTTLLNPRRYGAMTFEDYARYRLSVFSREEARAIVSYLRFRRERDEMDLTRQAVDAALEGFWLVRAEQAPTARELLGHLEREKAFLETLDRD